MKTIKQFVEEHASKKHWDLTIEEQIEGADKTKLCMFFYMEERPPVVEGTKIDLNLTTVTGKYSDDEWWAVE